LFKSNVVESYLCLARVGVVVKFGYGEVGRGGLDSPQIKEFVAQSPLSFTAEMPSGDVYFVLFKTTAA
jgi:hypothetical protein